MQSHHEFQINYEICDSFFSLFEVIPCHFRSEVDAKSKKGKAGETEKGKGKGVKSTNKKK